MAFERRVQFAAAYDKRPKKPGDPNYGIHGVDMLMHLIGSKGAITFRVMTGWDLPHVVEEFKAKGRYPLSAGANVSYHSPVPVNDYHDPEAGAECDVLACGKCWGDSSYLAGDEFFKVLIAEGDAVWSKLEQEYVNRFGEET